MTSKRRPSLEADLINVTAHPAVAAAHNSFMVKKPKPQSAVPKQRNRRLPVEHASYRALGKSAREDELPEQWRTASKRYVPGPSVRSASVKQPPRFYGPVGSAPPDFPNTAAQECIARQRAEREQRRSGAPKQEDSPVCPVSMPGVKGPAESPFVVSLAPSVRIASHYSETALGLSAIDLHGSIQVCSL